MLKFAPLKALVGSTVHWLKGSARFVLVKTLYCSLSTPLVPLITKLVPDKLMLVMCGCGGGPDMDNTVKAPLSDSLFVKMTPTGGMMVRLLPLSNG